MKQYEYKMLSDTDTYSYSIDDVNELGKQGWRVIYIDTPDYGHERTLLEREIVI